MLNPAPAPGAAGAVWERALDNFLDFLPRPVRHWVLVYEGACHQGLAAALCRRLDVVARFDLGEDGPGRIGATADAYRDDECCGFIELAATDAWELDDDLVEALMRFAAWPERRVRFCFDLSDGNFPLLFSEGPASLGRSGTEVLRRVAGAREIRVRAGGEAGAMFSCDKQGWTLHDGSDPADYLLPTGEIECVPRSAAGEIAFDGWIVGTLPFGRKYGRIAQGALTLRFVDGRIEHIEGRAGALITDLTWAFERIPALRVVSELGFGLSRGVTRAAEDCAIGCLWHERHYGAHIGIGATLEREGRTTGHHLDFVLSRGSIEDANGRMLLGW